MASIENPQLDHFITTRLPHFIAIQYQHLLTARTPETRVRAALRVFELGVRALGIGIITQYLVRDGDRISDPALNDLVKTKLPYAVLDTWTQILFLTLRAYQGQRNLFFMPELYDLYWDSASFPHQPRAAVTSKFKRLVEIYNDLLLNQGPTSDAGWEALCTESLRLFYDIFQEFAFLENYELVRILDLSEKQYTFERHTGLQITIASKIAYSELPLETGWFYLAKDNGEFLKLHPLLIFWQEPSTTSPPRQDSALFERFLTDQVQYLNPSLWEKFSDPGTVIDFVRLVFLNIENLKQHHQHTEQLTWLQIQEIAHTISTRRMAAVSTKYNPTIYTQRQPFRKIIQDFLTAPETGLILTGKSGVGKTSFLLSLAQEFRENRSDVCLLLYDGAKIHANEPLTALLNHDYNTFIHLTEKSEARPIRNILEEIAKIAEIEQRRILFCIDGLNENPDAKTLLEQADELVTMNPYPWLKVIISCRPEAWRILKNQVRFAETSYYQASTNPHSAIEMSGFTRVELPEAYEKYRIAYNLQTAFNNIGNEFAQLLTDPLILQLIARSNQNRIIPTKLQATEIYELYLKHLQHEKKLDRTDLDFLQNEILPLFLSAGHYANTLTPQDIDRVRTQQGIELYHLIHNDGVLSSGRHVNQAWINLCDADILVKRGSEIEYEIGFKYERFYDYFGGQRIHTLVHTQSEHAAEYQKLLSALTQLPFLWGALANAIGTELKNNNTLLLKKLAQTENPLIKDLMVTALTDAGRGLPEKIEPFLKELIALNQTTWQTRLRQTIPLSNHTLPDTILNARRAGIESAAELGLADILVTAASDNTPAIRAATLQYTHRLWRKDPLKGISILERVAAKAVHRRGLPNLAALETTIGLSLIMLFEGFQDPRVINGLQKTWRNLIDRQFFLDPTESGIKKRAKDTVRELFLQVATKLVFQLALVMERANIFMFGIREIDQFFHLGETQKSRYRRLVPYLNPQYGNLSEIENEIYAQIPHRDMLTAELIWGILTGRLYADPQTAVPVIQKAFEQSLTFTPPTPYAGMLTPLFGFYLDHWKMDETIWNLYHANLETHYKQNKFAFATEYKIGYSTNFEDYIPLYYSKHGTLHHSLYERYLWDTTNNNHPEHIKTLSAQITGAGESGSIKGSARLHAFLSALGLALETKHPEFETAAVNALGVMHNYFPDQIDNFMQDQNLSASIQATVHHAQKAETLAYLLMGNASIFFVNGLLLNPNQTFMDEFTWIFQQAPDCNNFAAWVTLALKKVINLVYGNNIFPIGGPPIHPQTRS